MAFLVVELELLNEWELLAELKEVVVLLRLLGLVRDNVCELVVYIDWHVVVVVHRKLLHVEMRSHHGAVESGASSDAFKRVQGALQLFLLKDLLDDCLHDRGSRAITNKLNEVDLIGAQA